MIGEIKSRPPIISSMLSHMQVTASSDCSAQLWDLSSGKAIRLYNGHYKAVTCCALNDSAICD